MLDDVWLVHYTAVAPGTVGTVLTVPLFWLVRQTVPQFRQKKIILR
jgi:hypothetical protein